MPELPEVETVRQSLEKKAKGLTIIEVTVHTPQVARAGAFADFASALQGLKFLDFERRGKYLVAVLEKGIRLVVHLRMTGRWVYCAPEAPLAKHTHVVFRLSDGNELRFTDVRRFGGMEIVLAEALEAHSGLAKLGVEPLSEGFSPEYLGEITRNKKARIKPLILDQSKLAGLGNIYADEALFLAGIHPGREAGTLSQEELKRLHLAIRHVLEEGIANKGTSFRDYVDGEGRQGQNQLSLKVYGRSGLECVTCGMPLAKLRIGGRSSVYCPNCQGGS